MLKPEPMQSTVARYLVDPLFLADAINSPAPPLITIEQLHKIKKVQAFIVKVKHNALRKVLPCTLRLLSEARLEISFFSCFAATYIAARSGGPLSVGSHVQLLAPALRSFLEQTNVPASALIRAMLSHEAALLDLSSHSEGRLHDGLVSWNGSCVLLRHRFDVATIAAQLRRDPLSPGLCHSERDHHLLYQGENPGAAVSVREVDMLTSLVFRYSSAAATTAELALSLSHMAGCTIHEGLVVQTLEQARAAGIATRINRDVPEDAR